MIPFVARASTKTAVIQSGWSVKADAVEDYLASLGISNLKPLPLKFPDPDIKLFNYSGDFDPASLIKHFGKPTKEKVKLGGKGPSVPKLTFEVPDNKGQVCIYPTVKRVSLRNQNAEHFPFCTPQDMSKFISKYDAGHPKVQASVVRDGVKPVTAYVKSQFASGLFNALSRDYKLTASGGRAGGEGSNYAWSAYDFNHPQFGKMIFFLDHRPSFDTKVTATNVGGVE